MKFEDYPFKVGDLVYCKDWERMRTVKQNLKDVGVFTRKIKGAEFTLRVTRIKEEK